MADDDMPPFITPIQGSALQLHELFQSLVAAGFTEEQALELLKATIISTTSRP